MGRGEKNYSYIASFLALGLLLIQRFLPGVRYYPVIDDWFLYGDIFDNIWTQHVIPNQKFAIRPMAGLADTFIAAPLFNHLWVVKLMICIMLFAAAMMLHKVLKKNNFTSGGMIFLTVCLLPLNLEATYWLASALRSVCALFFISLAALFISDYSEKKKIRYLSGYIVAGFAAVGFCEQAIAVYLFLSVYLILKSRDKKLLVIPMIHAAAIMVYYICFRDSAEIASRGQLLTDGIFKHTKDITVAAAQIYGEINSRMLASGFSEGADMLLGGHKFVLAVVAVFSIGFGYFASAAYCKSDTFELKRAIIGFLTAVSGIAIFYALSDTRFTIRSVFFFTVGISIFAGELLLLISVKVRKWICIIGFSAVAFIFTVSGIGIVNQFNTVSKHDTEIVNNMIKADTESDVTNPDKYSYLLDTFEYYSDVTSVECWESIRAGCSGYAELTGCMRHALNTADINNITPVRNGDLLISAANLLSGRCRFFALMPDLSVINVRVVSEGDEFVLVRDNGELYGILIPDGDMYRFEKSIIKKR